MMMMINMALIMKDLIALTVKKKRMTGTFFPNSLT